MKLLKVCCLMQFLAMALLAGCGGGGSGGVGNNSNSTGALTLSATTSTTVDVGTPIGVSAQFFTSIRSTGLNGLTVTFSSPDAALYGVTIVPVQVDTDSSGQAQTMLATAGNITKPQTVTLYANLNGLQSNPLTVTLNPKTVDVSLGSLAMSSSTTSVSAGASFSVSAVFSYPYSVSLAGQKITFTSDRPDIIASVVGNTDLDGRTTVNMIAKNTVTTPTTVNIKATLGNLVTTPVPVVVKPATMVLTPPASATFALKNAPEGAVVRWVISGAQVAVTDSAGNPIQNQPITLSVQSIVNQQPGDQVVFFPDANNQIIAPPGTLILTTDSNGKAIIPLAVDITAPAPVTGSQHVISVVWNASMSTPGGVVVATGSSLFTITNGP